MDREEIYKEFDEKYWFFDTALEMGDGWIPLIRECFDEILKVAKKEDFDDYIPFRISQIKEKFGGLRIYLSSYTPELESIVDKYEVKSYKICEVCGKPGELKNYGWFATLCDEHYEERIAWKENY